jgi:tetratricopeptide (TPR) repeat protein
MRRYLFLFFLGLALAAPATAQMKQQQVDRLFERLDATDDPVAAEALQAAIWESWTFSEDPAEMQLMLEGIRQMGQRRLDESVATFTRLIALNPDRTEAWNKRATAHWLNDDHAASMADIAEVLKREPRHFGALSGMGMILTESGDFNGAVKAYEAALKANKHLTGLRDEIDRLKMKVQGKPI